jgi:antitoxin MazE
VEVERKIRKIGNSLGIIVPSDYLKQMGLKEGDSVYTTFENGKIVISSESIAQEDAEFENRVIKILDKYLENERK